MPVVLFHDGEHGEPLIDALARFGDGLPANVLPVAVNEVTQVGLEAIAAVFAYGAVGAHVLTRAKPRHDMSSLQRTLASANAILAGSRLRPADAATSSPPSRPTTRMRLRAALDRAPRGTPAPNPATLPARGREARRAGIGVARAASGGPGAPRRRSRSRPPAPPFGGLEVRGRGLHAVPVLRQRLPDARPLGQPRAADAALRRVALRPVRIVRRDLPGKRDHA